jgi:pullulanase
MVPNDYHRLAPISGQIALYSCCDNTATENVMMEKLMTDSLVVWARDYKIHGFRFDLMAHQPKSSMLNAQKAVQPVDSDIYFYSEGWNFGEVANNPRFTQASQLELGGTRIGTFTDRLRDAVRGGAFSASGDDIRKSQGIGSSLGTLPHEQ